MTDAERRLDEFIQIDAMLAAEHLGLTVQQAIVIIGISLRDMTLRVATLTGDDPDKCLEKMAELIQKESKQFLRDNP